ncbi:MAG: peptidoglycan bridge formation glycyltransferase FemA/FemB family protein [Candidatus Kerfeldbacteria bacterium]|nr:peptidoglycan bridge formation glycyltransferase FemA/FemB family protein [Candidatus Kerfeldbacteria bacterium]
MEIKPIAANLVSEFVAHYPAAAGLFLQTPSWFKFQTAVGRSGEYLGFYNNNELIGVGAAIFHTLGNNWRYVYLPRGPVIKKDYLDKALGALIAYYKNRGFIWLRIEPPFRLDEIPARPLGFIKTNDVQPATTSLLDLTLSVDELLKPMHSKTRYNIRLAEKKNLTWELVGLEGYEDFWRLLQITAQRDGIKTFNRLYYQTLVDLYGKESLADKPELAVRLAQVKHQGQVLASCLLLFSGDTVTYLHGASSNEQRVLMPVYLLHWRAIQTAKDFGYKHYDWGGVALTGQKQKTWQGITRFKLGWGGATIDYAGTYDFVYKIQRYRLYNLIRIIKRFFKF